MPSPDFSVFRLSIAGCHRELVIDSAGSEGLRECVRQGVSGESQRSTATTG
jgi:hypothetical protein